MFGVDTCIQKIQRHFIKMNEAIKQDQKNYKKEINREVRLEKKK